MTALVGKGAIAVRTAKENGHSRSRQNSSGGILVLTAFREDVALKPEELTAWFAASGWDERAATELTNRFYAHIALISEYQEIEGQPA